MSLKHLVGWSVLSLFLGLPVAFADPDPSPSPGAPDQLKELNYFRGTWKCTGKHVLPAKEGQPAQEEAYAGTAKFFRPFHAHWYVAIWRPDRKVGSHHRSGVAFESFNTAANQFVSHVLRPLGEVVTLKSDGFQGGDTFVWSGTLEDAEGQPKIIRITRKKINETTFENSAEFSSDGVTFTPHGSGQCVKNPPPVKNPPKSS